MPIRQNWLAWGDSDYSSFNRNGYAAIHPFEDVHASSPFIHTRSDVLGLSVNNLEQSKRFTELNLGMVATMAGISGYSVAEQEEIRATMYPNPAKESVSILAEDGIHDVTVCNLMGQQIMTQNLNGKNEFTHSTSDLVSGIYVVKILTEKGMVTKRLVIQ